MCFLPEVNDSHQIQTKNPDHPKRLGVGARGFQGGVDDVALTREFDLVSVVAL